jgi:hypothetical protein
VTNREVGIGEVEGGEHFVKGIAEHRNVDTPAKRSELEPKFRIEVGGKTGSAHGTIKLPCQDQHRVAQDLGVDRTAMGV